MQAWEVFAPVETGKGTSAMVAPLGEVSDWSRGLSVPSSQPCWSPFDIPRAERRGVVGFQGLSLMLTGRW